MLHKLQQRQDQDQTVQVWQEHLNQAQSFISRSLPDEYESACEDLNLCELHESLLLRHHSAFHATLSNAERSGGDDDHHRENAPVMSSLQALHQESLARIRDRHAALEERAQVWQEYRASLTKLLDWLDAAEREKKRRLEVRRLQEHSLPTALRRVDVLLDKLGQGQALQLQVEKAAGRLLDVVGAEESGATIRADVKSAAKRLVDLEAWLCTWRDFLRRVSRLYDSLERGNEDARDQLKSVQNDLLSDKELPAAYEAAAALLQTYRVSVACLVLF